MSFETRYEMLRKAHDRPNLRVFITPFSHNDPGWLRTFLSYFQQDSRQILNFVIDRMQEYRDMTFIWAELSILQLWWDQAHPTKQRALKHLINSGRFEIVTGGWVSQEFRLFFLFFISKNSKAIGKISFCRVGNDG